MSELSDWIQSNWLELGSLLLQFAILVSVIRYARKALNAVRIAQETGEAPQRLSLRQDGPASVLSQPFDRPSSESVNPLMRIGRWLNAPVGGGRRKVSSWKRFIHWLQAPAGS